MEYRCVYSYSFVDRRRTTAETTAAAAHLGVTTHMFFLIVVPWSYPELSEGSVQQHPSPCSFLKRLGRKRKKYRAGPTSSTFHFLFSCGIVHSRGNRTPESEKKADVGISRQTENENEILYTYQVRIYPLLL